MVIYMMEEKYEYELVMEVEREIKFYVFGYGGWIMEYVVSILERK